MVTVALSSSGNFVEGKGEQNDTYQTTNPSLRLSLHHLSSRCYFLERSVNPDLVLSRSLKYMRRYFSTRYPSKTSRLWPSKYSPKLTEMAPRLKSCSSAGIDEVRDGIAGRGQGDAWTLKLVVVDGPRLGSCRQFFYDVYRKFAAVMLLLFSWRSSVDFIREFSLTVPHPNR